MNYAVNKNERPVYLQIYRQIRNDIISGVFEYDSRLPSKRVLAADTGVSTVTVEHAYALLCDEGYAESRERSGFFVIFRRTDGFAAAENVSTLQHNSAAAKSIYPGFPVSVLSKTMRRVLTDYGADILKKPPNSGCLELRNAILRYIARNRGINVSADQIIIGSGAEYLYGLIISLLGRDRIYAIESPSYDKLERIYGTAGVTYERLPLRKDGIESRALAATRAQVLHTTPYRSYPSGVTATASKRHEYIRWSAVGDRYIIESDYGSEFSVSSQPMETLFALSEYGNVIYLNTFSKTISPSVRAGYMILPQKLVKRFYDRLGFYSCTVPTYEQLVLAQLINSGDFERHINRVRRSRRRLLSDTQK